MATGRPCPQDRTPQQTMHRFNPGNLNVISQIIIRTKKSRISGWDKYCLHNSPRIGYCPTFIASTSFLLLLANCSISQDILSCSIWLTSWLNPVIHAGDDIEFLPLSRGAVDSLLSRDAILRRVKTGGGFNPTTNPARKKFVSFRSLHILLQHRVCHVSPVLCYSPAAEGYYTLSRRRRRRMGNSSSSSTLTRCCCGLMHPNKKHFHIGIPDKRRRGGGVVQDIGRRNTR